MIVPPHPVGAVRRGQAHGPIVARTFRVLAPALVAAHGLERRPRHPQTDAIGPAIAPEKPESPRRRALVALALQADDSGRAECTRNAERTRRQPAAGPVAGKRTDADER